MSIRDKDREKLRLAANELVLRLEKIPEPEKHELFGFGSITVARLIMQLREFRSLGQNFVNEYVREVGKFKESTDTRLVELEEQYGLPSPPGGVPAKPRIRRFEPRFPWS